MCVERGSWLARRTAAHGACDTAREIRRHDTKITKSEPTSTDVPQQTSQNIDAPLPEPALIIPGAALAN